MEKSYNDLKNQSEYIDSKCEKAELRFFSSNYSHGILGDHRTYMNGNRKESTRKKEKIENQFIFFLCSVASCVTHLGDKCVCVDCIVEQRVRG